MTINMKNQYNKWKFHGMCVGMAEMPNQFSGPGDQTTGLRLENLSGNTPPILVAFHAGLD